MLVYFFRFFFFFARDAHFRRMRAPSEVTPRWKLRQQRQWEKLRQSPSPRTLRTRRDTRAAKARFTMRQLTHRRWVITRKKGSR